ncbi:MAG TPA: hypothetical protein VKY73_07050 [Polyangiaceae bacterium]|nr:hypothetical protein [Polyangiaceae bacterium]
MDGEPSLRHRQLCRREARFAERDPFVDALLGVIAYGKRLERALTALPAAPNAPARGDRAVDVALGAIALFRRARRILERWANEAPPVNGAVRSDAAENRYLEGLLR